MQSSKHEADVWRFAAECRSSFGKVLRFVNKRTDRHELQANKHLREPCFDCEVAAGFGLVFRRV